MRGVFYWGRCRTDGQRPKKYRLSPLPSLRVNVHIGRMPKAQKPYRTARGTHHGMAERPQRHFETGSPATAAAPRLAEPLGLAPETDDFVPSIGSTASAEALQRLIETGRPEF